MYQQYLNHQYNFTHLFDMLIPKTSLTKIRTNNLALEINEVSIEDDTNNKETEHDHIMVAQSGDPNNKSKPAYKKTVLIVIKTTMVFQIVIKNNAMTNIKYIKIKDQEPLNSLLYNTFVVNPKIHKKSEMRIKMIILPKIRTHIIKITPIRMIDIEITTDIEATEEIIHRIIIDQIPDKDTIIDLKARMNLDLDTTITIKEELHPDLHIDHHTETIPNIDIILDEDIDLVLDHKETPLDDTITRIDLYLDEEITDDDLELPHKTDNKIQ